MILDSVDLWNIVDESDKVSPSNKDSKVFKAYQIHVKKAMSISAFHLADNILVQIKGCKVLA